LSWFRCFPRPPLSFEFDTAILLRRRDSKFNNPRRESCEPVDLSQPGAQPLSRRHHVVSPCYGWSGSGENDRWEREGMPPRCTISDAASPEFSADAATVSHFRRLCKPADRLRSESKPDAGAIRIEQVYLAEPSGTAANIHRSLRIRLLGRGERCKEPSARGRRLLGRLPGPDWTVSAGLLALRVKPHCLLYAAPSTRGGGVRKSWIALSSKNGANRS
jgi:hypothetical protein